MADKFQLKAIISAVDKLSPTLKGIRASAKITKKSLSDIGNATRGLGASLGISGVAIAAGLGFGVKKIIDVSAEFERFQTILETIEGSSEKAKASMAWVQDFAAKTPYELAQTTDAFVKLKAYGIDPQAGALAASGNAAAAMGKDLNQAVEALADAMTGENERLKEFGIKANKSGDKITYSWSENGKTMVATAKASSKEQIEAVISGIWNRRFGGAMDKLSGTWTGMLSNIGDQFTKFVKIIGDGGAFDFLKGELSGVLQKFNDWEADGTLKKIGTQISQQLVGVLKELITWAKQVDWGKFFGDIKTVIIWIKDLVSALGGVKTIFIALGVLMLAGPMTSILAIGSALWKLTYAFDALALSSVKSGAAVAGSMGTAATGSILSSLGGLARNAGILSAAALVGYGIGTAIYKGIEGTAFADKLGAGIARVLAAFGNDEAKAALKANGDYVPDSSSGINAFNQNKKSVFNAKRTDPLSIVARDKTQLNGEMTVRFENAPPGLRVDPGKTNQPGVSMNPDVGYRRLNFGL